MSHGASALTGDKVVGIGGTSPLDDNLGPDRRVLEAAFKIAPESSGWIAFVTDVCCPYVGFAFTVSTEPI